MGIKCFNMHWQTYFYWWKVIFSYHKICFYLIYGVIFIFLLTSLIYTWPGKGNLAPKVLSGDISVGANSKVQSGIINEEKSNQTRKHLPHCIIIGASKAGTRALLDFMSLHPSIAAAEEEVHFFDKEENFTKGYEWYLSQMPSSTADQITVEKTPAYFVRPHVPRLIHDMNSTIKLILIVRDPVERTVSHYLQMYLFRLRKGIQDKSFVEHVIDKNTGGIDETFTSVNYSIYYNHTKNWLDVFGRDQILILSGEKLVSDPASQLFEVENFLGLDHQISKDKFYFNETKGFYCIHAPTGDQCLIDSKGRKHPDIDPELLEKLRNFFHPYNKMFYELVGQDFGWS